MSSTAPKISGVALLRLMNAASSVAVVGYGAALEIVQFGPAAERLFGWDSAQALDGDGHALLHDGDFLPTLCARAFQGPATAETRLLRNGGDLLPARVTICPAEAEDAPVCWWVLYQDLEEVHGLRERLREQVGPFAGQSAQVRQEAQFLSELLRHTAENIQIGIAVVEASTGQITYVNDGFEGITGFSVLDAMTRTFADLLEEYPVFRGHLLGLIDDVVAGGPDRDAGVRHWEIDLPSGKRDLETYARLIAIEGFSQQFILLIIEDNTERQRLQMQLVQSEKLAAIGQLAAGIAHEIRNPLNTIYNALYDLDEIITERTAEISEDIEISMEEIRRVQDIINNLLDFARETERPRDTADLADVVRKTVRLVQHDLTNKRIDIELDIRPTGEVALGTNALKQILINIITNAAQAMPKGGTLVIRAWRESKGIARAGFFPDGESARLQISDPVIGRDPAPAGNKECVLLQITDTGAGIPKGILPNVFNPFFTTKEPGSGTGLGLSVVHSLVRDAGGGIGVESAEGRGTTFTFELPLAPQS